MIRTDGRLPLVGLRREQHVLCDAVDRRESLLVLGPAGSGKTRLLESALESGSEAGAIPHISEFDCPHDLVVKIAGQLFQSGHRGFCRMACAGSDWEGWLRRQTSVHLKGLLWESLETEPRILFLDGLDGAGHQTYRFLQRLHFTPGAALVAAARDHLHLGELHRLFWDPRKTLHVQPLSEAEALELFEAAADHFGLRELSLDDFRERVLDSAGGNPGQIIEMCRLARDPRYLSGRYIKFALVRIDAMMEYLG